MTGSSSRRTPAGRIRPATDRCTRTSSAPRCRSLSRTRTAQSRSSGSPARGRRRRSACSSTTRATSGCPILRTCRRFPRSPRRNAAARARATTTCPRPTTSAARSPSSRAAWCCKKCDAKEARKIDLLFLSIGGNDVGFARLVANAVLADKSILRKLGGWFGQVHGFAEANGQLDALDDRLKSVNRALHNLLHVPWSESDRVILTGLSADGAARRWQDGVPGRTSRHDTCCPSSRSARPRRARAAWRRSASTTS